MDNQPLSETHRIVEKDGEAYAVGPTTVLYRGILWDKRQFSLKGMRTICGVIREEK